MAAVQPAGPEPMMMTFSTLSAIRFRPVVMVPKQGTVYAYARPRAALALAPAPTPRDPAMSEPTSRWASLREILRYVPRFRERVFVIALDGAVVEGENFRNLLLDIALL